MNLESISILLNRKEVKTVMLGLTIGQLAQYLAKKYIEKHPEVLEEVEPPFVIPDNSNKLVTSRRIIILVCTASGGILHFLSKRYLSDKANQNHSDSIDNRGITKNISRRLPPPSERVTELISRGGGLSKLAKELLARYLAQVFCRKFLILVAKHGTAAGLSAGILYQIPVAAVAHYIAHSVPYASPQNLPHLEDIKFRIIDGGKVYIDLCHQNFEYLFNILEDPTIPYHERNKIAEQTLTQYLELSTNDGRLNFIICMVTLLLILFSTHTSGFHLLFQALIKALREGKLSKRMARVIIRRLQRKGIPISPEFIDLAN